MAQRGDAPCPDPDELASAVPSDMSTVQGDIDRLTLCVERANLIQQLDEMVKKREEMLNPSAKGGGNQFDRQSDRSSRLQQIRRDQIDDIPKIDQTALNNDTVNGDTSKGDSKPPLESQQWSVIEIQGSGGGLTARLESENGNIIMVSAGDRLPTGQVVSDISINSGVAVRDDGGLVDLPWAKG